MRQMPIRVGAIERMIVVDSLQTAPSPPEPLPT
jgi:hypothetical protein